MRKKNRYSLLLLLGASPLFAEENLGDFLMQHVADHRDTWHLLPGFSVPINGSFKIAGIELYPSLHVWMMFIAAALLLVLMRIASRRTMSRQLPKNRWGHMVEAVVLFLRDDIVVPNLGKRGGRKWMPFFLTLFFFILTLNLLGLVPGFSTATSNPNFTFAMAAVVFIVFNVAGMVHNGPITYFTNLIPKGVPLPVLLILVPIELVGLFTKAIALAIRLFANMTAGHIIVASLLAVAFVLKMLWVQPVFILFALAIDILELFIAFLQAYVFTMLSALFIGGAVHQEH